MKIHYQELNNGVRLIKLVGKLDVIGVGAIETKFNEYCSGEHVKAVVDLSGVDFLASIGIRLLITTAKSLYSRQGRMALLNPTPETKHVLEIAGITDIIPMYEQFESAEAVLLG